MIRHVVLVELPEAAEAHRPEITRRFAGLGKLIPGVVNSSAGTDFSGRCQPYSLVALMEIEDRAHLDAYQRHPEHLALVELLDQTGCRRIVADIEA